MRKLHHVVGGLIEACIMIMKHDGMECNLWPVVGGLIEACIMTMKRDGMEST